MSYPTFEDTSEIQRFVVARAVSGPAHSLILSDRDDNVPQVWFGRQPARRAT